MLAKEIAIRAFWLWLTLLVTTWGLGLVQATDGTLANPWRLLAGALFFACFFLIPLWKNNALVQAAGLSLAAMLTTVGLWPQQDGASNPYTLLVCSILAGYAALILPAIHTSVIGGVLAFAVLLPNIAGYHLMPLFFLICYIVLIALAIILFRVIWNKAESAEARNEALLGEYRKLRRMLVTSEEAARQEERAQVGRDIHDSVGHKLTALLMQLEIFRMEASSEDEAKLRKLKELAQQSLHETRTAVRELKHSEVGGLPAIMRLIRQLELENVITIHFTIRYGAMSATLTREQSIAIYRVVQEALTNIMKHGSSREAEILFEAPGDKVFRFEIRNPCSSILQVQEGFGLRSMRERIEGCNGELNIICNGHHFIISATIPIHNAFQAEGRLLT